MATEPGKALLWITNHAVVEGKHWSTIGKQFGEILQIISFGKDFLIFRIHTEEDPLLKIKLQRKLLFAPIPELCM